MKFAPLRRYVFEMGLENSITSPKEISSEDEEDAVRFYAAQVRVFCIDI